MTGSSSTFGTTSLDIIDALGRKWEMADMDMGAWSYRYDALGNLTSQIDARTCTTTLTYDSLSRPLTKSYSGTGCTTTAVSYGYDATTPTGNKGKGKRTSMSDGSGSTTWLYGDNRGRLTKEVKTISSSGTYTTQWAYDSADQVTSMTYPDNEVVSYGYLPQMLNNTVSGSSTYVAGSWFDAAGRVELRTLGSGTGQIRTDYNYNGWNRYGGRLDWVRSGTISGNTVTATLQNLNYKYDLNANVTVISDTLAGGTQFQNFIYDTQDRIISATVTGGSGGIYSQGYSYDSYGRLLNGPKGNGYTYDTGHKHAVATAGGTSYTYDNNGNMITRTGYTFGYDAENRLVSVSRWCDR